MAISPDVGAPMIYNAASKYGVPDWVLTGVFGMESGFGANMKTSKAGAIGSMQFIPSTARAYNYPYTATPNTSQLQQQFDAAAHYLSDLNHQFGSWAAAIQHYSGGGYTLAQVQAKSQQQVPANEIQSVNPGALGGGDNPATSGGNIVGLFSDIPSAIAGVFQQAVSDAKYAGVLIVVLVLGAALILHGLSGIGGGGGDGRKVMAVPV